MKFQISFLCVLISLCVLQIFGFQSLQKMKFSRNSITSMSVVELTKDGGVKKEILANGKGKKVEVGDILAAEYTAYVKGSSKPFAKGDKERFIVKDGSLIKGWDIAVNSMTIGEKSKVTCSSEYAYGSKGIIPVIPPDSDIEVDIKILAWLGNSLQPESLFQKDLDIDPFIASTPESIQAEYDEMQVRWISFLENLKFSFYFFLPFLCLLSGNEARQV